MPYAVDATARAVYGPIPGTPPGPRRRRGRVRSEAFHHLARGPAQGERPPRVAKAAHARRTSPTGASASAATSGKRSRNPGSASPTHSIWVCWDIVSATHMAYGSVTRRMARSQPCVAYQPSSVDEAVAIDRRDVALVPFRTAVAYHRRVIANEPLPTTDTRLSRPDLDLDAIADCWASRATLAPISAEGMRGADLPSATAGGQRRRVDGRGGHRGGCRRSGDAGCGPCSSDGAGAGAGRPRQQRW